MPYNFMQAATPSELVRPVINWLEQGCRVAMITLVNIEGNAPYPVGSQIAVNDQGDYLGQITGGCAEMALVDQALVVINSSENVTLRYGLGSPFFDIQLPCGSGIDVYFDCETELDNFRHIASQLEARNCFVHNLDTKVGVFAKKYLPNHRMILFGQGPIMAVLAQLALKSGFDVACVAQNEQTLALMTANGMQCSELSQDTGLLPSDLDEYTAVVSLFHEHELETDILASALTGKSFYIGALGSKRTHAARLESLERAGVDKVLLARICGPVGLNIGANTPAQIAVSILAQVIEYLNFGQ